MSSENTIFDPRGDIKLCVGETDPVTFTACSRALARTSPVFERMLFGRFIESKPSDDGEWIVKLSEDKPGAMSIFLRISHGQFNHVPQNPSIDELYDLTVLSNFYDSTGVLEPWIQRWVSSVEDKARATEETMVKGLWIGWEFGRKDTFARIARRLLMESRGSEHPDIQTPPDIIEQISAIRISTIQALLDVIGRLISHLVVVDERPRWCQHAEWMGPHRCESMILGSITFCLYRAGLWPLPKAEDVSDSIVGLHRKLKGLVIHDIGKVDGLDHATCNPGPNLFSEMERIYTEIPSPVTNFQAEKMDEQMKRLTNS
ncbi:uncharacterized protein B0J16DRAFT_179673 [Fusarium flagelliforme]|uniref:Nuclear pore protein n=1 Tax=Fusarium flagelliforme TaxID=2675880 RepID=A0A395M5J0_9HYPO|nr:uncharacterized protein B0J16DRAFT_179673 [Fusarium flagelliforme]KAH7180031.1 hypothetical protein B0J16DRAFT_179673 [Fusarium flagelliforme]RFN43152.1 hypothetical protein FIE12Z_12603 [Fusarium flagelliforme]